MNQNIPSVTKSTLEGEISITRNKINEIKSILFGGEESNPRPDSLGLIEKLIDEIGDINLQLEDVLKAIALLK